jgi:ADP-heptose:LPS heptosyltransferase
MKKLLAIALDEKNFIESIQISINEKQRLNADQLTILTYRENANYIEMTSGIDSVHYIDRKKINTILTNGIYSDAFAINTFFSNLESLLNEKWDMILNIFNNRISNYLCSALEAEHVTGLSLNKNLYEANCAWSNLQFLKNEGTFEAFNDYFFWSKRFNHPFNQNAFHIDESKSALISTNLNRIRKQSDKSAEDCHIIGFYINEQTAHLKQLAVMFNRLYSQRNFLPVAIIEKSNDALHLIEKINQDLNHDIVSIETSRASLPTVLSTVDTLIASSSELLALSSFLEVPSIELMDENMNIWDSHTRNEGCFVIMNNKYSEGELNLCLNQIFSTELPVRNLNENICIYYTTETKGLERFKQVSGHQKENERIQLTLESYILDSVFDRTNRSFPFNTLSSTEMNKYMARTRYLRDELTGFVKCILSSLRKLKSATISQNKTLEFFQELENLIQYKTDDVCINAIIKNFEFTAQNIKAKSFKDRIRLLEVELFKVKDSVQVYRSIIERKPVEQKPLSRTQETNL